MTGETFQYWSDIVTLCSKYLYEQRNLYDPLNGNNPNPLASSLAREQFGLAVTQAVKVCYDRKALAEFNKSKTDIDTSQSVSEILKPFISASTTKGQVTHKVKDEEGKTVEKVTDTTIDVPSIWTAAMDYYKESRDPTIAAVIARINKGLEDLQIDLSSSKALEKMKIEVSALEAVA
jgi:hypothetical protein